MVPADGRIQIFRHTVLDLAMPREKPEKRSVASVIFFGRKNRVLLQQRDQNPRIPFPGRWVLFGGALEPGETPRQAARREMKEELNLTLEAQKLRLFGKFFTRFATEYIFTYPIPFPLRGLKLTEGQKMAVFPKTKIRKLKMGFCDKEILKEYFLSASASSSFRFQEGISRRRKAGCRKKAVSLRSSRQ